jgi:iron complex outermembrane receptor protein
MIDPRKLRKSRKTIYAGVVSYFALCSAPYFPASAQSTLPPVTVDAPSAQKKRAASAAARSQPRSTTNLNRQRRELRNEPVSSSPAPAVSASSAQRANSAVSGYVASRSVAGTKTDTPLLETPQAISVVTRQQLDDQKPQTVNEAFRYSSGVMPEPFGTGGHYTDQYLTVRGFRPDIYMDGLKLPPFSSTDPYFLERAEIVHGPASVLYGQSSPGGLVDLASKMPTDKPINEINIGGGTFGRAQASFDLGGVLDKEGQLLYRLTGVGHTDNTQVDYTRDQRFGIAPAITWRPDASTSFTVLASYINDPNMGIYAGLPALGTVLPNLNGKIPTNFFVGDPTFNTWRREQTSVGYAFEHRFDQVLTIRQNVRYSENTMEERHLYIPGSNLALSADQSTLLRYAFRDDISRKAFQTDNQAQLDFGIGPVQHKVTAGIDYLNLNIAETSGNSLPLGLAAEPTINIFNPVYGQATTLPPVQNAPVTKSDQVGGYAQDQMKWGSTSFVIGGRYDSLNSAANDIVANTKSDQQDHDFTWRTGLIHVFDNGVAPYVSYSTSFQPQVGLSRTATQFVPTTGQQYEAGVKFQPTGYDSFVTASIFDLTQQNVLTPDPVNPVYSVQTGEIRSRGAEIELHANVTRSLSLIAAYTHLDNVVTKANPTTNTLGKVPVGVPADSASLWVDYAFKEGKLTGFGLSGGVRYVGETYGTATNLWGVPGFVNAPSIVPSVTLFDAAVRYDFDKHWRVSLNATNLFDKTYVSSCTSGINCYYGYRRTVLANLRYAW